MFLVNSCLGLFSAACLRRHPFSRSYGVNLPSSLTRVPSSALGFSPRLPVSVCGTGGHNLPRSFSWRFRLAFFGTIFPPRHASPFCRGDLPPRRAARLDPVFQSRAQAAFPRHSFSQTIAAGTGISTSCPSPTPFGLGLGPDLPWADDPSPGNLRFSADKILTCLFVYLYQHSPLYALQRTSQFAFSAAYNAPLPLAATLQIQSFGTVLQPRYIFGARPLDQ